MSETPAAVEPAARPVVIVTAASRGIGAGIARELAATGHRLVLFSSGTTIHTTAAALGATAVQGSLTDPVDLERLVATTMSQYGRIDALVNGGGHAPNGPLLELTDQDWHDGLDMVLLSVVRLARLVTPQMLAAGHGAIVNLSSYTAFEPMDMIPLNSTLRATLGSFAKLFANQYAAHGRRMTNVLPGFVDSFPETPDFLARIPAGRYATVAEIGKVVRFLISDDAAYINGESIKIDGGAAQAL